MIGAEALQQYRQLLADGQNPQATLQSLLASHEDPTVRLVAEWWSSRAAEAREEEERQGTPEPEPESGRLARLESRLAERERQLKAAAHELDRLFLINDSLAAALGACPACWGEIAGCRECGGEGGPGSLAPDLALYVSLVSPAVRRVAAARRPAAAIAPRGAGDRRPLEPSERSPDRPPHASKGDPQ